MGQPDEDFTPGDHLAADERDPEVEPADAVEQAMTVDPVHADVEPQRGMEVDDWDAMEQARVVTGDEYDYR
ncbi:hypothetical protein [Micromonospora sp. NPDC049102]|uniref:hypothetical protein n=1 Tax=Micromonospora sp. NPDC049102 TaxID=3364265 RepID=UPI0037240098